MPTWKDVIKIGLALPETEVSTWYRTPSLKVAGKGFVRLRTEAEGGLVVLCDLEEKARLLESGDPAYYTTPHYDGGGAIIVNLKEGRPRRARRARHEFLAPTGASETAQSLRRQDAPMVHVNHLAMDDRVIGSSHRVIGRSVYRAK